MIEVIKPNDSPVDESTKARLRADIDNFKEGERVLGYEPLYVGQPSDFSPTCCNCHIAGSDTTLVSFTVLYRRVDRYTAYHVAVFCPACLSNSRAIDALCAEIVQRLTIFVAR